MSQNRLRDRAEGIARVASEMPPGFILVSTSTLPAPLADAAAAQQDLYRLAYERAFEAVCLRVDGAAGYFARPKRPRRTNRGVENSTAEQHYERAPLRSDSRSCTSSIPTLERTNPSSTPRLARISVGMLAWVMEAGWQISDSTPPRLSAG